jgi:putative acetyltransferase
MLTIAPESPLTPDLTLLMQRHTMAMHAESPPESIHMMDAGALARPGIWFFVMRDAGEAVGMGAVKRIDDSHAEIKSMHVLSERRGKGLSRLMLDHLVRHALGEGFSKLSLETGSQPGFAPARGLYSKAGFAECEPFEGYGPDANSVFMTRMLGTGNADGMGR